MNRSRIIVFIAAGFGLVAVSFQAGRQTTIAERNRNVSQQSHSTELAARSRSRQTNAEEDHKILIGNVASIPFAELYYLLRFASPEKRSAWATELNEMPAGTQKFAAIEAFYKTLVQVDPKEAVKLTLATKDHRTQCIAADAVAGAAPESAMGEVAKMAIELRPPYCAREAFRAFFRWSRLDPVAASRFAEEHPKDIALEELLYNWAAIDLAAAKEWFAKQDESSHNEDAISGLLTGWEDVDRAGALGYAAAHGDEKEFQRAIRNLASTVFLESPDQARGFIDSLPSDDCKRAAIGEIKSITTGIILGGSPDWPRPPGLVAKWMVAFPKEIWRDEIGSVIEAWANEDADSLVAWMNQLPEENRDLIAAEYCLSVDKREPERAIAAGMRITDTELREQTLGKYLSSFGRTRQEAIECLNGFKLSAKEKASLAKLIPEDEEE